MGGNNCKTCGGPDTDTRCMRCGSLASKQYSNSYYERGTDCTSLRLLQTSRGVSSVGLRMLGMLLITLGLLITSMAIIPESGDGGGVVVIFPFVFSNVSGWAAVALTVVFTGIFIATSLLPWFIFSRRGWGYGHSQAMWEPIQREPEVMEYMITIDLPRRLRKTVYIEGDGNVVHLKSSADESFHRRYTLPEGFAVNEYSYEYDGSYLLLNLKLKSSI